MHTGKPYNRPHKTEEQLLVFVALHLKISHDSSLSNDVKGTTCPIMPLKIDECVTRMLVYN